MMHTDICIAGAGIIGLSLALELQARGLSVTVVEAGQPIREASWAAAGMLAAHDPHNPAELFPLAELSVALYPEFVERLRPHGAVPFQTIHTLQSTTALQAPISLAACEPGVGPPADFDLLEEQSIDPRQLAASLFAAVGASPVRLFTGSQVVSTHSTLNTIEVKTPTQSIQAAHFIDCTGAWAGDPEYRVLPIKGQMLAVALPSHFQMNTVVRTADIYIVPRTLGPSAGRAIIGATVEDIGFDKVIHAQQIQHLRQEAIALLPELAQADVVDTWSGLRPAAADRLPILGAHPKRQNHWIATGHYRNGILLAPATARVMAQALLGEPLSASLESFAPSRLALRTPVPQAPSL